QNFYNLADREEEREMIPYCQAEGVAVVPWSPIARGFLAGNTTKQGGVTERGKKDIHIGTYFGTKPDFAILQKVEAVARKLGVKPAQVAYAWVMSKPGVTSPIVGATKEYQLDEAIQAVDVKLDAATIRALEAPYRPRAVMGI
ncbi:MAG: aldo/keto reductase, partial [Rhizobiaceae bacterium]